MSNWQKIETAPKDGTVIIGAHPEYKRTVPVSWQRGKYRETWYEGCSSSGWDHPGITLWQPLPEPPTE